MLSANLLLRESPFYIVNGLKSFEIKVFFVYALNLLRCLFWQIYKQFLFVIKFVISN